MLNTYTHNQLRAIASVDEKKFPFCTSKTHFFYFTHLFLQNTHISLSIIHIYSNKIFISLTQHNPHSHHLSQDRRLQPPTVQQDWRRNPHKPIIPESQRKPVKKKKEKKKKQNPVTKPKSPQRTTKKLAPQSPIPLIHTHNHWYHRPTPIITITIASSSTKNRSKPTKF